MDQQFYFKSTDVPHILQYLHDSLLQSTVQI